MRGGRGLERHLKQTGLVLPERADARTFRGNMCLAGRGPTLSACRNLFERTHYQAAGKTDCSMLRPRVSCVGEWLRLAQETVGMDFAWPMGRGDFVELGPVEFVAADGMGRVNPFQQVLRTHPGGSFPRVLDLLRMDFPVCSWWRRRRARECVGRVRFHSGAKAGGYGRFWGSYADPERRAAGLIRPGRRRRRHHSRRRFSACQIRS